MALLDFLLLGAGAGAAYYLLKPPKKIDSVQELLDFKEITPSGIIELPGNKYRLVIEVEPINMNLRSIQEQAAIWLGFRNMVNALTIPVTFLIQTRYLNLKNYFDELQRFNANRPEKIKNLAMEHIKHLQQKTEGKHLRDRRYFIILKVDSASQGVESGIQIENQLINTVIKAIPNPNRQNISPEVAKKAATDDLFETASIIMSSLEAVEIMSMILDKKAVLEMLYQTFNRDLAPFMTLEDADSMGMFSLFVESVTPEKFTEQFLISPQEQNTKQRGADHAIV